MLKRLSAFCCLALTACPASGPIPIPCRSNANCPTGQGCNAEGLCEKGITGVSGSQLLVTPQVASVLANGTLQFTASLDGNPTNEVTWLAEGSGGVAVDGLYTAPASVPTDPVVTITATSMVNPLASARSLLTIREVMPVPKLTSITPNEANLGAPAVTLTATGSDFVPTTDLRFDDVTLATTYVSGTQLTGVVPAALLATGKTATVKAVTPGLGGESAGASFTVNNPPAVLGSINPTSAVAGSGATPIVLSGTGFATGAVVTFGGTPIPSTVVSATQLTANIPVSSLTRAGVVTVAVRNPMPGGGGVGDQNFRVEASIRTVIGGFTGDNGLATAATLSRVAYATMSPGGELYYSEPERHRVMRIDLAGRVRRVAGNTLCAFTGDGNASTAAQLCSPRGLAFDVAGNLYIADSGNARIRRIDAMGTISTFAGTGSCNYGSEGNAAAVSVGDVTDLKVAPSGNLYFAAWGCTGNHRVRRIAPGGMTTTIAGTGTGASAPDNVTAATATLNSPLYLALDAQENVYVSEFDGHRVRRINTSTGIMTIIAGTGSSSSTGENVPATAGGLANPRGIAFDAQGNLLIASSTGFRIRKVDLSGRADAGIDAGNAADAGSAVTPTIATYVGTGASGLVAADGQPALMARIGRPAALVFANGSLYFSTLADVGTAPNTLKRLDGTGVVQPLVGGAITNTVASDAFVFRPWGVAFDSLGNAYVSDRENDRIWKVDSTGAMTPFAGTGVRGFGGDGSLASTALISAPEQVQVDTSGEVYFVDAGNGRVRKVDTQGNISTVAGGGSFPAGCGATGMPSSVPAGAGPGYNCYGDDYFAANAVLLTPRGLLKAGTALYISEYDGNSQPQRGHRIRRVELSPTSPRVNVITTLAGSTVFPLTGSISGFAGDSGPATAALLNQPAGMALDASGDLLFADSGNHRIRKVNLVSAPIGVISTVSGSGSSASQGNGGQFVVATWRRPWALVFDTTGNLFISDLDAHNVRRVDGAAIVTPVAGTQTCSTCTPGFAGDGLAAKDALLAAPAALNLGPAGQLYIGDTINERVRAMGP